MTIIEYAPEPGAAPGKTVLDLLDLALEQCASGQTEAKYIVVGTETYGLLREAMGERFGRGAGEFETYQYLPIVLDPFRERALCVLPAPAALADGAQTIRAADIG
jgi:hypothetical protein